MHHIKFDENSIVVHHHLGFGDHIICNGMVRYLLKHTNAAKLWLVTKGKNINNIKRMYADENRINFIPVEQDSDFYDAPYDWNNIRLVRVGFEKCKDNEFDKSFYDSVGVPFCERWDSFYFKRNVSTESSVISELDLPEKFGLVHNTSSIGSYDLNIATDIPLIHVRRTKNESSMFDWMGVVDRATEIHCIDSSFIHMVESMNLPTQKLYYHNTKNNNIGFSRRNNWKVLSY